MVLNRCFLQIPLRIRVLQVRIVTTRLYQRSRVTVAESEQSYQAEDCNSYTWKQKSELKTAKDRVFKIKVAQQYSYCVKFQ